MPGKLKLKLILILTLSPPSGGGPDVAICFSIFSFFFLFSSTDRISKMPRDAAFKKFVKGYKKTKKFSFQCLGYLCFFPF